MSRYRFTLTDGALGASLVLTKYPIGWDDATINIDRHKTYHGVFINYTFDLKFVCNGGGKEMIDEVFNRDDIDGDIAITVEFRCDSTGTYEVVYTGVLDLSKYKVDGDITISPIRQNKLVDKVLNRDDISIDLETTTSVGEQAITPINTITLPMPSQEIRLISEWVVNNNYIFTESQAFSGGPQTIYKYFQHSAGLNNSDISTTSEWYTTNNFPDGQSGISTAPLLEIIDANKADVFYPMVINYEVNFKGEFTDNQTVVTPSGAQRSAQEFSLNIYVGKSLSNISNIINLYTDTYSGDPTNFTFDIVNNGSFNLNQGEKVWFAWFIRYFINNAPTIDLTWEYERSSLKFYADTTYKETSCKTALIHEAFNQVVDSLSDEDGKFYSELYGRTDSVKQDYEEDGEGSLIAVTNGLNIREFNKPINCSLKDLFATANALHNIGLTVLNEKIRVEKKSFFYDADTQVLFLPKPSKVSVSVDVSHYFNRIITGYQKWETEYQGGLNEPLTRAEWSNVINTQRGTYEALSPYIASSNGIELTRRYNIEIAPDEDYKYDNDNFIISVVRNGYLNFTPELEDHFLNSSSGMLKSNTAYNLRFTPARMLQAHFNALTGCLQKIQGNITWQKGEGNTAFASNMAETTTQCSYSGETLIENQNYAYNDTNAINVQPLYGTLVYDFQYPLSWGQYNFIQANPHGFISFYNQYGQLLQGYIISIKYLIKTGMASITLLQKI